MANNGPIESEDQGPGELPGNAAMEVDRTEERQHFQSITKQPSYFLKQKAINAMGPEQKKRYQAYLQGNESHIELGENKSIRSLGSPK